jgi:hypothetical protein
MAAEKTKVDEELATTKELLKTAEEERDKAKSMLEDALGKLEATSRDRSLVIFAVTSVLRSAQLGSMQQCVDLLKERVHNSTQVEGGHQLASCKRMILFEKYPFSYHNSYIFQISRAWTPRRCSQALRMPT